jgi:hypothetical protein
LPRPKHTKPKSDAFETLRNALWKPSQQTGRSWLRSPGESELLGKKSYKGP